MDAAKQEILNRFNEGESALQTALGGVDPESATAKPSPDQWSIVEIVEHVAASEAFLLDRLRHAVPSAVSHADPAREARLESLALNRERKIDAPEPVLPIGDCATLAQALHRLRAVRVQTIEFVENFSGDLRSSLVEHPAHHPAAQLLRDASPDRPPPHPPRRPDQRDSPIPIRET